MYNVYKVENKNLFLPEGKKEHVDSIGDVAKWIADPEMIPSHLGELYPFKAGDGYLYYTTIGYSYLFEKI